MAILKLKDNNGNVYEVPAIVGPKGDDYILTESDKQEIATEASKLFTKSSIGLGNVDNTSDANKPVSTAQREAIIVAQSKAYSDAGTYTDKIVAEYQPKLVSGTNLKTVNGQSLLGSGNITLGGLQLTYLGDFALGSFNIPSTAKGIVYAIRQNHNTGMRHEIFKYGIIYGSPSNSYSTTYHLGFTDVDLKNMGMYISVEEEKQMLLHFVYNNGIECTINTLKELVSSERDIVIECPVWIIE